MATGMATCQNSDASQEAGAPVLRAGYYASALRVHTEEAARLLQRQQPGHPSLAVPSVPWGCHVEAEGERLFLVIPDPEAFNPSSWCWGNCFAWSLTDAFTGAALQEMLAAWRPGDGPVRVPLLEGVTSPLAIFTGGGEQASAHRGAVVGRAMLRSALSMRCAVAAASVCAGMCVGFEIGSPCHAVHAVRPLSAPLEPFLTGAWLLHCVLAMQPRWHSTWRTSCLARSTSAGRA